MAGGYRPQPTSSVEAIAAQLRDLQAQLDAATKALTGLGLHIDGTTGDLIFDAVTGKFRVVDSATGVTVLEAGKFSVNDGSGRTQSGVVIRRGDDGTAALSVLDAGTVPGHTYKPPSQWYDRAGHIVFADDDTGDGLARPHLGVGPLLPTDVTKWPGGFATVFTTIASCYIERQNPQLWWSWNLYSPAATTTQFRLLVSGTQIGTTQTVTNAFAGWTDKRPVPGAYGDVVLVELQVKATSGTGSCAAQQLFLEGSQS